MVRRIFHSTWADREGLPIPLGKLLTTDSQRQAEAFTHTSTQLTKAGGPLSEANYLPLTAN